MKMECVFCNPQKISRVAGTVLIISGINGDISKNVIGCLNEMKLVQCSDVAKKESACSSFDFAISHIYSIFCC